MVTYYFSYVLQLLSQWVLRVQCTFSTYLLHCTRPENNKMYNVHYRLAPVIINNTLYTLFLEANKIVDIHTFLLKKNYIRDIFEINICYKNVSSINCLLCFY